MTIASAPGKAFICGEYAVLLPKTPALVLAVDRRTTVEARRAKHWSIDAGGVRWHEGQPLQPEIEFVHAVIETMRARFDVSPHSMRTTDDMHEGEAKLGLGGSAAVTVAAVFALAPPKSSREQLWAISDEVHRTVQGGKGSGADVAASVYGGVIKYTSEPRTTAHFRIHSDVRFLLAWSGSSVSTAPRISAWSEFARTREKWVTKFAKTSATISEVVADGLELGHPAFIRAAMASAGSVLRALQKESGIVIETPPLKAACDAAFSAGACGKVSGAGGGDCAIVIAVGDKMTADAARAIESVGLKAIAVKPGEGARIEK